MGPDFICIGAPKAGTTWIYKHLAAHPDVWIPLVKELHYFDRKFGLPRVGEKVTTRKSLFGLFPDHSRRLIARKLLKAGMSFSAKDIRWCVRYFGGNPTDEWYISLFADRAGKVCGELTTDYCALSRDSVGYIGGMLPGTRIIFMMRDPVQRAWSHAKMLLPDLLNKRFEEISDDEFMEYLSHPAARLKGDYLRTLANWESEYPDHQVFIGFYDDIVSQPRELLTNMFRFLGVPLVERVFSSDLEKKVNVSKKIQSIPSDIHATLARMYLPSMQELRQRFGGCVDGWVADALAALR